jgi:trimethylamine:corrinoid methyltransferase-like protein
MPKENLVDQVEKMLGDLSLDELYILNNVLVERIKYMRTVEAQKNRQAFTIGDEVEFINHRLGTTIKGKLVEIRRVKAIVQENNSMNRWRVPIANLSTI